MRGWAVAALTLGFAAIGLPEEPLRVAGALLREAGVHFDRGEYAEAEALHRQALDIQTRVLPADHPDIATNLHDLGELSRALGRRKESEELLRRALEIRENVLGPQHPDVARTLRALAGVYFDQKRFYDAEPLLRRALAIWDQASASDSLEATACLNTLGSLDYALGDLEGAERQFLRGRSMQQRAGRFYHAVTAALIHNLARVYAIQRRYGEAEGLFREALSMRESLDGPRHPDVAVTLEAYAALLRKTKRKSEARALEERAKAIRTLRGRAR